MNPSRKPPRHTRYTIVCSECRKRSTVPFAPIPGRSVFCGACHAARKGSIRLATEGIDGGDDDLGIVE